MIYKSEGGDEIGELSPRELSGIGHLVMLNAQRDEVVIIKSPLKVLDEWNDVMNFEIRSHIANSAVLTATAYLTEIEVSLFNELPLSFPLC